MQNVVETLSSTAQASLHKSLAALSENILSDMLEKADIRLNGHRPWDIKVHDPRLFFRVLSTGTLGAGEAYMEGWWDCDDLSEMAFRLFRSRGFERLSNSVVGTLMSLQARLINTQTVRRSKAVAQKHYDLGNDLYFSFLDPYHQYSCGFFHETEDLATAQRQKMELICQKLHLKSGDRVLDIGCGWGGLAKYMAETYNCQVVGVTISDEQFRYAREWCQGLPVSIQKKDYRDIEGEFDKVVSVGMFEHVGYKNYRTLMEVVHRSLVDGGLFLLHSIGGNQSETASDAWLVKYIFPNSMIPSAAQISTAAEGLFVMEDWHNFGLYYAKTLKCWYQNFERSWPKLSTQFDERFFRMWRYYLLTLVGTFRARQVNLWQVMLSKGGVLENTRFRRETIELAP